MPSIGDWILLKVEKPSELARKVNRRLSPGTMSVPRNVPGAVRITVGDPKSNQTLFHCLRELFDKSPTRAMEAEESSVDSSASAV